MTDTWDRRALPHVPGWNNAPVSGPIFTVNYNAGTDELTITVNQPIFGPVDTINYQGTNGTGQLNLGVHFTVDSPTQITVPTAAFFLNAPTDLQQLDFFSPGPTLVGTWTGTESIALGLTLISADSTAENRLEITGTGFDTADNMRVLDNFSLDTRYYDENGPNAGLNPVGATVVWTDTLVTITDPDLSGLTVTQIQARDVADVFIAEFYPNVPIDGPPLSHPIIEHICSPAPDTIRFTGQRFLTADVGPIGYVIPRLLDYATGLPLNGSGMIYELADGSPDANGWSVVTHTDTVLEISNPAFTSQEPSGGPGDFVVTGAALHDPTATTMYYYEPWGETFYAIVNGAGCDCSGIGAAVIDPDIPLPNFGDRGSWHPSGARVAVTVSDTDGVLIYDYDGMTLELGTQVDVQTDLSGSNYHADWSADGQYLAVGGSNGGGPELGVYDAIGGTPVKLPGPDAGSGLPATGTVRSVAFHPTLPILAVAFSQSPYLALFEIDAGVVVPFGTVDVAPTAIVTDIAWMPGGEGLAVGQQGANGLLSYWFDGADLQKQVVTGAQPAANITSVKFAPDYTLAVGSTGGAFLYMRQTTGFDFVPYGTVPNPGGAVLAVDWNAAGDVVMIAGNAAYDGVGFLSRAGSVFTLDPSGTGGDVADAYTARFDKQGCAVIANTATSPYVKAINSQ